MKFFNFGSVNSKAVLNRYKKIAVEVLVFDILFIKINAQIGLVYIVNLVR